MKCPICGKDLKYINNFHLMTHGYRTEKEFKKDYPDTELKSNETKLNIQSHINELNSNSKLQSFKAKKEWESESFRDMKSKEFSNTITNLHKYDKEYQKKIVTYGRRLNYTRTNGELIKLRSFLECRISKMLELNNIEFEYEYLRIKYYDNNKQRSYYPDFYVSDCNLVIEGKPSDKLNDNIVLAKMNATKLLGYNYMFITEKSLVNYKLIIDRINALRIK